MSFQAPPQERAELRSAHLAEVPFTGVALALYQSLDDAHKAAALADLNRPFSAPAGYQCKTNYRRTYLSCADRDAYDEAYAAFPKLPAEWLLGVRLSPRIQGYLDAEAKQESEDWAREESRQERVRDERAREDK